MSHTVHHGLLLPNFLKMDLMTSNLTFGDRIQAKRMASSDVMQSYFLVQTKYTSEWYIFVFIRLAINSYSVVFLINLIKMLRKGPPTFPSLNIRTLLSTQSKAALKSSTMFALKPI